MTLITTTSETWTHWERRDSITQITIHWFAFQVHVSQGGGAAGRRSLTTCDIRGSSGSEPASLVGVLAFIHLLGRDKSYQDIGPSYL